MDRPTDWQSSVAPRVRGDTGLRVGEALVPGGNGDLRHGRCRWTRACPSPSASGPPRGQGSVSRLRGRVGDSGSRTMCASVGGRSSSIRPLGSERCALDSERRAASARTTGAQSLRMVAISLSHMEANPASSGLAPAMRRRNCSGSTLRESSLRNARRFAAERSLASRSVTPPFWRPTAAIVHLDTKRRTRASGRVRSRYPW